MHRRAIQTTATAQEIPIVGPDYGYNADAVVKVLSAGDERGTRLMG
jgi:hypothetical protein